jgi:hypothetical protein
MDQKTYDAALQEALGLAPDKIALLRSIPASDYKSVLPNNKEQSLWYAANKGKIARGPLKLRQLGKSIRTELGLPKDVDISAILKGGDLDHGPYLPLP